MRDGTGLKTFSETCPDRFFDVGIAEEHALSMACGMAKQGLIPAVAIYSTFLQRAFDMLLHDLALLQLHVVLGSTAPGSSEKTAGRTTACLTGVPPAGAGA